MTLQSDCLESEVMNHASCHQRTDQQSTSLSSKHIEEQNKPETCANILLMSTLKNAPAHQTL